MMAATGHLGVIQSKKGLQVGHQVGVDALQRLQQRNSRQLRKRLLDLGPLLVEVQTPGQSQDHAAGHNVNVISELASKRPTVTCASTPDYKTKGGDTSRNAD